MRFVSVIHSTMSISHSTNALLVRPGPFNPAESFVHAQNLERTPPEKGTRWMYGSYALACVLFGTRAFLVLYLSSSHPLMSGGTDSRLDYYLTCNGSTGGVPDTDRMFSGRLLTRNAMETDEQRVWNGGPRDQTDVLHLAKLPTTPILNCGNLIITNYLITILSLNLSRNSTSNYSSIVYFLFPVFAIPMLFAFPKVLWLAMDLLLYGYHLWQ